MNEIEQAAVDTVNKALENLPEKGMKMMRLKWVIVGSETLPELEVHMYEEDKAIEKARVIKIP